MLKYARPPSALQIGLIIFNFLLQNLESWGSCCKGFHVLVPPQGGGSGPTGHITWHQNICTQSLKKKLCLLSWSALLFHSQRNPFLFFMAPRRLCRAEVRCVADGYPCCASETAEVH